jgi:hypothetical protein
MKQNQVLKRFWAVGLLSLLLVTTINAQTAKTTEGKKTSSIDAPILLPGSTNISIKTSTSSQNPGITYGIDINGNIALKSNSEVSKNLNDGKGFVIIELEAPSAFKGPGTIPLDLDNDKNSVSKNVFKVSETTSIGLRGQGEMPTAMHPRSEIHIKDKKGDYGSALLISRLQPLGYASEPFSFINNRDRKYVVVVTEVQAQQNASANERFMKESTYVAKTIEMWDYTKDFIASIINDPLSPKTKKIIAEQIASRFKKK